MGYMGFGMRKEVYTRKPRKPFVKLRKLLEIELKHEKSNEVYKDQKFSKAQIETAKVNT